MIKPSGPWCDVCSGPILGGNSINPFFVKGIQGELHCHDKCKNEIVNAGTDYKKLPDGPLKEVFSEADRRAQNRKLMQESHFDNCIEDNCEKKWCVDRRNSPCSEENDDCEIEKDSRCKHCHIKYFCSGTGWCEIHGEHGP